MGYIYGHNLKSQFEVQSISYFNEHFDITTVEVSSGVEAGQCSKGRGCYQPYLLRTLPKSQPYDYNNIFRPSKSCRC